MSRKWVVFTCFDHDSWKNRLREIRRRFQVKRAKWTLRTDEVRALGHEVGFALVHNFPLVRVFSGHSYAALRRRSE